MIPLILAPIIAELAKNGLNLIGNAILNKGKDVIEDKLGVKVDELLVTDEGKQKLLQLQTDHEQFLINSAIEDRKVDLEFYKLDAADRASAREREIHAMEAPDAGWLNRNIVPILALTIIAGGLATINWSPEADVRLGAISLVTLVLGYYFGNTSSNWRKDSTINTLAKKD